MIKKLGGEDKLNPYYIVKWSIMTLIEQRCEDKFDWKTKNMNEGPMVCRKRWVFTGDRARCRRTVGPHRTQDLETRVSLQRRGRDVRTTPRSSPDDLVISALYAVRYGQLVYE